MPVRLHGFKDSNDLFLDREVNPNSDNPISNKAVCNALAGIVPGLRGIAGSMGNPRWCSKSATTPTIDPNILNNNNGS